MKRPLKITLAATALVLAVGSFLGFPNDRLLGGIFWIVIAAYVLADGMQGASRK